MKRDLELETLFKRLDEVRMSDRERIRARAHLERAEAIANLLADGGKAVKRLFRQRVLRPIRRIAHAG